MNYQDEILPNTQNINKYEEIYQLYKKVYPTIKELSHQLTEI